MRIKSDFAGKIPEKMGNSPMDVLKRTLEQDYYWEAIGDPIEKWAKTRDFADGVIITFRDHAMDRYVHQLIARDGECLIKGPGDRLRTAEFHMKTIHKVITAASSKFSPTSQERCDKARENLLHIARDFPYMINRILNAIPYVTDNIGLSCYKWEWDDGGYVSIVHEDRELFVCDAGKIWEVCRYCYLDYDAQMDELLNMIMEKYNVNNFQFSAKALKKYRDIALIASN